MNDMSTRNAKSSSALPIIGQNETMVPPALKPPVNPETLTHRDLLEGNFWERIHAYHGVDEATFLDHRWQSKKTITRPDRLLKALQGLASESFIADVEAGFARAPMAVRISPYLLSLIDWSLSGNTKNECRLVWSGSARGDPEA